MSNEKDQTVNGVKVIWKNILYTHFFIGDLDKFHAFAKKLEYPFYMWNGRVYNTKNGKYTGFFGGDSSDGQFQFEIGDIF